MQRATLRPAGLGSTPAAPFFAAGTIGIWLLNGIGGADVIVGPLPGAVVLAGSA